MNTEQNATPEQATEIDRLLRAVVATQPDWLRTRWQAANHKKVMDALLTEPETALAGLRVMALIAGQLNAVQH